MQEGRGKKATKRELEKTCEPQRVRGNSSILKSRKSKDHKLQDEETKRDKVKSLGRQLRVQTIRDEKENRRVERDDQKARMPRTSQSMWVGALARTQPTRPPYTAMWWRFFLMRYLKSGVTICL